MPAQTALDIVLPCYNPPSGWEREVVSAMTHLEESLADTKLKLLIVNDGSTKGIKEEAIEYIRTNVSDFEWISYEQNRGKGYALREGVSKSEAPYCIYTDIDFPYEEVCVEEVYGLLRGEGNQVVAAVRDQAYYANVPKVRIFISKLLRAVIGTLLRIRITDTQAGLKGFDRAGRDLFLKTRIDRYLFDLEFIYLSSHEEGVKMQATEARLKEGVIFSKVSLKILATEAINFMRVLFRKKG